MPTGTYSYTANKPYYQGMIYSSVPVNEGTNEQVIELPRALGRAQVTVKNASGQTLTNATVTLEEDGTSKTTNSSGYARFTSVPAGEVVFSASMDGYTSQSVTATIAPGNDTYDPYTPVEIILPSV